MKIHPYYDPALEHEVGLIFFCRERDIIVVALALRQHRHIAITSFGGLLRNRGHRSLFGGLLKVCW